MRQQRRLRGLIRFNDKEAFGVGVVGAPPPRRAQRRQHLGEGPAVRQDRVRHRPRLHRQVRVRSGGRHEVCVRGARAQAARVDGDKEEGGAEEQENRREREAVWVVSAAV